MNLSGSVKINKCGVLLLSAVLCLVFYYLTFSKGTHDVHKQYGLMMRNPNEISLRKLLIGGIQAAQMGGLEVVAISRDFQTESKGKTKEGANDPVTTADLRSHCVMQRGLQRLFSKLKIISEEDSMDKRCPDVNTFELDPTVLDESAQISDDHIVDVDDVTVWIDPLDATQEYTESLFEYVTTMVCVAVKGEPVIGIVHNPFTKETVWAWRDEAVSEQLRNIQQRNVDPVPKNPKVIVSRSHPGEVQEFTKNVFGVNTPIINAAGAGYKVLQVVFNNATAYIHLTRIKKWDICAGNAILNALGGRMTTLTGEHILYTENGSVINDKGLLAALNHHSFYTQKIADYQREPPKGT